MKELEDKIKNELEKTISSPHYNGWHNRTSYGYHSYNLSGVNIVGQRNPRERLSHMRTKIDFKNKNVLDLGCNVGSMLHHLNEIDHGIGLDYDEKCVSAANNISNLLERENLNFYVHDFDKDSYESMFKKINFKPDIIFILSLGSWVKKWELLYGACLLYNCKLILETNNKSEGIPQLNFFRDKGLKTKLILDNSKDDSTGNSGRKTYLISGVNNK